MDVPVSLLYRNEKRLSRTRRLLDYGLSQYYFCFHVDRPLYEKQINYGRWRSRDASPQAMLWETYRAVPRENHFFQTSSKIWHLIEKVVINGNYRCFPVSCWPRQPFLAEHVSLWKRRKGDRCRDHLITRIGLIRVAKKHWRWTADSTVEF